MKQEMMGWQWHQLDHMQIICTSLQTDNHASTSSLGFLQAGCTSCRPTNSVKPLKAIYCTVRKKNNTGKPANQGSFGEWSLKQSVNDLPIRRLVR